MAKSKEFKDMSKKERKSFLSMDLIERMVRVEQKVAASFGKKLPYNKTDHYKKLTKKEKRKFDKYLKNKGKKKKIIIALFSLPVLFLILSLNFQMTGYVIGEGNLNFLQIAGIVLIVIFAILIYLFSKKKKRYERHFSIIDDWLSGKYKTK